MENEVGQAKRQSVRLQAQVMEFTMRGGAPPPAEASQKAEVDGKEMDSTGRSEAHQLKKVPFVFPLTRGSLS